MPHSRGVGQYVASEVHCAMWGRGVSKDTIGILQLTGSHGVADKLWLTAADNDRQRHSLLSERWPILSGDQAQTVTQGTFGSPTVVTRVGQMKTFAQGSASPIKFANGPVLILGGSGGIAAALNYARANPANVKAIASLCGLLDIQDFYASHLDASVTAPEVHKAYNNGVDDGGIAFNAAMPASNPAAHPGECIGFPIKLWYSTDDHYIDPLTVTKFRDDVNGLGGNVQISSVGAQGHSVGNLNPQEIVDFFLEHV